jgi:hypothetical protein
VTRRAALAAALLLSGCGMDPATMTLVGAGLGFAGKALELDTAIGTLAVLVIGGGHTGDLDALQERPRLPRRARIFGKDCRDLEAVKDRHHLIPLPQDCLYGVGGFPRELAHFARFALAQSGDQLGMVSAAHGVVSFGFSAAMSGRMRYSHAISS